MTKSIIEETKSNLLEIGFSFKESWKVLVELYGAELEDETITKIMNGCMDTVRNCYSDKAERVKAAEIINAISKYMMESIEGSDSTPVDDKKKSGRPKKK